MTSESPRPACLSTEGAAGIGGVREASLALHSLQGSGFGLFPLLPLGLSSNHRRSLFFQTRGGRVTPGAVGRSLS